MNYENIVLFSAKHHKFASYVLAMIMLEWLGGGLEGYFCGRSFAAFSFFLERSFGW
jgi:hypothetical protein